MNSNPRKGTGTSPRTATNGCTVSSGTARFATSDENKFWGRMNILDLEKTEGKWTREAAAVKVTWPSGTIETWELPLFDGYQPVTWNRFDGRVQSLIAKQWEHSDYPAPDHTAFSVIALQLSPATVPARPDAPPPQ